MALLLETINSCVSPFVQKAEIEAMTGSQEYVDGMISTYRNRRDLIVAGLNEIRGLLCLKPGGAFYVFPSISGTGLSSEQFSDYVLKNIGIATCPGKYFWVLLAKATSDSVMQIRMKKYPKPYRG